MNDSKLAIYDAEWVLQGMLEQAHIAAAKPDLVGTWNVFKSFTRLIFDASSDGILVEYGNFSHLTGTPEFLFTFVRQFQARGADEFEQLRCCFYYAVTDELANIKSAADWWFRGEQDLQAFLAAVEANPVFQLLQSAYAPARVEIYQTST